MDGNEDEKYEWAGSLDIEDQNLHGYRYKI